MLPRFVPPNIKKADGRAIEICRTDTAAANAMLRAFRRSAGAYAHDALPMISSLMRSISRCADDACKDACRQRMEGSP
jgi:hypothetical protein